MTTINNKELAKEGLLKHYDYYKPIYLNWHEEGGAEVFRLHSDVFALFEIPIYGGEPRYRGTYNIKDIDKMIDIIFDWT